MLKPADWVTINVHAIITGLTRKAIEKKIENGYWLEGKQFKRAPDGRIFISVPGYYDWVEGK